MGITIQDAFKGAMPQDETDLVSVSDELWTIGTLAEIRRQASPALFNLHVAMNAIGSWKGDGWHEIVSGQPQLVPHIPAAMEALGLMEISEAFQSMIAVFPDFVVFSDDSLNSDLHYDAVNFLQNARLKVSDERLATFGRDERQEMCERYAKNLQAIEALSERVWSYGAPGNEGWDTVLNYVRAHFTE